MMEVLSLIEKCRELIFQMQVLMHENDSLHRERMALMQELVKHGVRTIRFGKTEVTISYDDETGDWQEKVE
tara:strand:+ start:1447 stop:1659 length:213 start_codon:yes stop_codon:yes gene_type:complete